MDKKDVIAKINEHLEKLNDEDLKLVFIFVEGYRRKKATAKGDT